MNRTISIYLCLLCFFGCSPNSTAPATNSYPHNNATNYFKSTETITLEIYYETGAEPFVGLANTQSGKSLWDILRDNLASIFQYRTNPPSVTVPSTLDLMTSMGTFGKESWTASEILNLNTTFRAQNSTATAARFYIYFLNGYLADSNGANSQIIGVSLSGTPIIAIFKDVVRASGGILVQRFVEQSTLVHEIGHALGLVNNGVPLTSQHQDEQNGKHTNDSDCIMYYLNEGASDLLSFIVRFQTASTFEMWGAQTLQDAQSFSE